MSFQDTGLSRRKRRQTGYTEQLQQYSSPGEVVEVGACTDKSWGLGPRAHQARLGSPKVEGSSLTPSSQVRGHACGVWAVQPCATPS